eukprot:321293-Alexandrium_andersonii.AAC.1
MDMRGLTRVPTVGKKKKKKVTLRLPGGALPPPDHPKSTSSAPAGLSRRLSAQHDAEPCGRGLAGRKH